ncbi:hypothetical protein POM88_012883 [Heracleum sosnowskyi]|uniref:Uncharacterized protein n=1 Tax=Heracleum sosnowskyi TaxID=360622 RepID=A0AAD8N2W2_9APIA|nr:hypothetical protein POM88_012883 [Heracleum sosnowskyi]
MALINDAPAVTGDGTNNAALHELCRLILVLPWAFKEPRLQKKDETIVVKFCLYLLTRCPSRQLRGMFMSFSPRQGRYFYSFKNIFNSTIGLELKDLYYWRQSFQKKKKIDIFEKAHLLWTYINDSFQKNK